MVMTSRRNTTVAATLLGSKKKARKPYRISRPREKWTGEEHERFLHSLLMFGRDWKTVEQFVGTKTATQIRSHAQKYFLKAHKLGVAAVLPPPHPRRAAVDLLHPQPPSTTGSCGFLDNDGTYQSAGGARWPCQDDLFLATAPNRSGEELPAGGSSEEAWFADCMLQDDTVAQLPLSPDDLRFAQVYRFFGDVFGSGAALPVEEQLQRLHGVDPLVAETILLVLWNLQDNLCAY